MTAVWSRDELVARLADNLDWDLSAMTRMLAPYIWDRALDDEVEQQSLDARRMDIAAQR